MLLRLEMAPALIPLSADRSNLTVLLLQSRSHHTGLLGRYKRLLVTLLLKLLWRKTILIATSCRRAEDVVREPTHSRSGRISRIQLVRNGGRGSRRSSIKLKRLVDGLWLLRGCGHGSGHRLIAEDGWRRGERGKAEPTEGH